MDSVAELEQLAGGPERLLELTGCELRVSPLKVRQIAAFARALRALPDGLLQEFMAGEPDPFLVAEYTPEIVACVQAAVDVEPKQLGELPVGELLALAMVIVEVNADFFVNRLVPLLGTSAARAQAILGRASSSTSSSTATDATTS